jgi:hypothetical protein
LGVKMREVNLVSRADTRIGVRHDPVRLAEEVCGVALVHL